MHGNEPAGVAALMSVISTLTGGAGVELQRGDIHAYVGNTRALQAGRRQVDADMNRIWLRSARKRLDSAVDAERGDSLNPPGSGEGMNSEGRDQIELYRALQAAIDQARGPVYVVDLHTTSSPSCPFIVLGDTLRNRKFARVLPVPLVLGLEEQIDGTLQEFMTASGHVAIGYEGGQHDAHESVAHHEAAVWLLMASLGMVGPTAPARQKHTESLTVLRQASSRMPPVMQIDSRLALKPGDAFELARRFRNFESVQKRQPLATMNGKSLTASHAGRIILPLLQAQGSDGYFLGRDIRPAWLTLSTLMRTIGADEILHLLPGVRKHPDREETLIVDPSIARWWSAELFHLLGYRVRRRQGSVMIVSRRNHGGTLGR
ncbi:MAG: hypothetical protein D8M59_07300 [Planctomycetes bacterium]|nr:hypothetical protein [Planctomycetota bacterium]